MVNRGSRTIREVARSLGVSPSMLNRWYHQYGNEVAAGGSPSQQRSTEEVEELRRRLRQLVQKNTLLKKAATHSSEGEPVTVFQFIHAEKANFPDRICLPDPGRLAERLLSLGDSHARNAINECTANYYNTKRLHSYLDYASPVEYELTAA